MIAIFKKELTSFFGSVLGYIVVAVFLIITGLFLFVFPETDYNIFDYGYASLDGLFNLAPWVFMFLLPAVTMRMISEEISGGTIEFLATRPVTDLQIVLAKYFAALALLLFSILPSLVYYYTVYQLGAVTGNIDTGAALGSYLGLFLLGSCFAAIGLFASSLTSNQVVAFLISVFLCFFFYSGFKNISQLPFFYGRTDDIIQSIGIDAHFASIRRGVVDFRDVFYFISLSGIFIFLTKTSLSSRKW